MKGKLLIAPRVPYILVTLVLTGLPIRVRYNKNPHAGAHVVYGS